MEKVIADHSGYLFCISMKSVETPMYGVWVEAVFYYFAIISIHRVWVGTG